jgi:hypothetical protein
VTRAGVERAVEIAAGIAVIAVAQRLQTRVDHNGRGRTAKVVKIRCECDANCGAWIGVPRTFVHERYALGLEQRFIANGHAHAGESETVHAFKGYQVIEPRSAARRIFWAADPWS